MTRRPAVAAAAVLVMLAGVGAGGPDASAAAPAGAASVAHWTALQAPVPRNAALHPGYGAQIEAVDCPSARFCVAVGSYNTAKGQEGLILTRNGRTWKAAEAPVPAGAFHNPQVQLTAVSCPSATKCLAVGRYMLANDAAAAGLLLTDSAGSWKARRAPVPANVYTGKAYSSAVQLNAAYCPGTGTCVVAGTYTTKKITTQGVLLSYRNRAWTAKEAPISDANLVSVSCVSSTSCAAVGVVPDPYNAYLTLGVVVAGFGSKWEAGKAPLNGTPPVTSSSALLSVACTHEDCTAGGWFEPPGGSDPSELLVMSGKGAHWLATEIQPPASGAGLSGDHVACPDTSACVFSAAYTSASQNAEAIETKTSAWATDLLTAPVKSYLFGPVTALACASATSCTAVGDYLYGYPAKSRPLIQQGFGTSWKGPLAPLPANGKNSQQARLTDVSCPTATTCVAVGFYNLHATNQGLLLTESG